MRTILLALVFALGCGSGDCPSDQPGRDSCDQSGLTCHYGGQRCTCEGQWYCVDNACPADTVEPRGSCSPEGTRCNYGFDETCTCTSGTWRCVGGFPMIDLAMPDLSSHD